MMGLGDVLGPADGSDLANHPAMKQRLSLGTVHTHTLQPSHCALTRARALDGAA